MLKSIIKLVVLSAFAFSVLIFLNMTNDYNIRRAADLCAERGYDEMINYGINQAMCKTYFMMNISGSETFNMSITTLFIFKEGEWHFYKEYQSWDEYKGQIHVF